MVRELLPETPTAYTRYQSFVQFNAKKASIKDKGSSYMENHTIRNTNSVSLVGAGALLLGASAPGHAGLLINEIDYDQPGADTAEFIELYNPGNNLLTLDGYRLDLVNGTTGSSYHSVDLAGLSIAANGYLVLCNNSQTVANCSVEAAAGSWIQNGGSSGDAAALFEGTTLLDSVVYESTGNFLSSYAEGGGFTDADSGSIPMSIARLPNGVDTDHNASDFGSACLTPGGANIGGNGDCSVGINPVPVPAAAWLFGSGLLGLIGISRRRTTA